MTLATVPIAASRRAPCSPVQQLEIGPTRRRLAHARFNPPLTPAAIDLLARTIHGETGGEVPRLCEAVANVAINRWRRACAYLGREYANFDKICRDPERFVCWRVGQGSYKLGDAILIGDPGFAVCRRVARRALAGTMSDPTLGAVRYHRRTEFPDWARAQAPCVEIAHHLFYNHVD